MLSKISIDLKKELSITKSEQFRLNEMISLKESELKLLYTKKINYYQKYKTTKNKKENLQAEFISIQKKLINEKENEIVNLTKHNRKKDQQILKRTENNKNELLEKDKKIKYHQLEYNELSINLFENKKKYELLQKNLTILELEKTEILKKVGRLNNSINSKSTIKIQPLNTATNKEIILKKEIKPIKKVNTNNLDTIIGKIFEK